jgi:microcystin-dependent protein
MLPYLGQIALFPYSFAPYGWMDCAGQYVPISQMTALFGLIGTAYGGNGTTTFCLPDLQGRAAIGFGPLPGGKTYAIGQQDGAEYVTITDDTMPAHNHALAASTAQGTTNNPTGNILARVGAGPPQGETKGKIYNPGQVNVTLQGSSIVPAGGSGGGAQQSHNNMQPSVVLRYCICVSGSMPT